METILSCFFFYFLFYFTIYHIVTGFNSLGAPCYFNIDFAYALQSRRHFFFLYIAVCIILCSFMQFDLEEFYLGNFIF